MRSRSGMPRTRRAALHARALLRRPAGRVAAAGGALSVVIATYVVGCLNQDRPEPAIRPSATPAPRVERRPPPIDRTMRVRLCGRDGAESFRLGVRSPAAFEDRATGVILRDAPSDTPEQIVRPAAGATGIRIGGQTFETDWLFVSPVYDAALQIDGNLYHGAVSIRRAGNQLIVNNEIDVEQYLPGVLAGELPASFHPDAQAALAVAARTYVLWQKQTYAADRDFDVLPDERSQMYVDLSRVSKVAIDAVRRTAGEICTVPDAEGAGMFCTYYASCCGGISQPARNVKRKYADASPLRGNVVCTTCRDAPVYRWNEVRLSKPEIMKRLSSRYPSIARLGKLDSVKLLAETREGRMLKVLIVGADGGNETLLAEDFRLSLGGREIRSTRCRMYDDGDGIVFYDGYGFGHGMGLCQYGANGMAKQGRGYRDILRHYYPGAVIRKIP